MPALGRVLSAFAGNRSGGTAIEFALVASPFFAMLFAAIQLFVLFFAQQTLETVAEDAGRLIMTGSAQKAGMTAATFKTAVCKKTMALLSCNNLMVDVQVATSFSSANTGTPTITYNPQGGVSNAWSWNPGGTGAIVVMRLMYLWPVINVPGLKLTNQGNNTHLMMATAVFKNESYN